MRTRQEVELLQLTLEGSEEINDTALVQSVLEWMLQNPKNPDYDPLYDWLPVQAGYHFMQSVQSLNVAGDDEVSQD